MLAAPLACQLATLQLMMRLHVVDCFCRIQSATYAAFDDEIACCGVLVWHTGERPFAGMRHAQIIYHVTTLRAHPEFPKDTPPKLKVCLP